MSGGYLSCPPVYPDGAALPTGVEVYYAIQTCRIANWRGPLKTGFAHTSCENYAESNDVVSGKNQKSATGVIGMPLGRAQAVQCFEMRMPLPLIETGHCNVDLKPSPIEPSWIIEGNPEARSRKLSASADGTAATLIWACAEGKFNWYYDSDETIIILEGSVVLESEGMPPKRYGVGDVIFFRSGAHVKWHVEGYVKKVAFCHQTNPIWIGFAIRGVNRLKRMFFELPAGHLLRFCFSAAILNGSV